jgi:hypothetical protein
VFGAVQSVLTHEKHKELLQEAPIAGEATQTRELASHVPLWQLADAQDSPSATGGRQVGPPSLSTMHM